jgi:hypothetical protein
MKETHINIHLKLPIAYGIEKLGKNFHLLCNHRLPEFVHLVTAANVPFFRNNSK